MSRKLSLLFLMLAIMSGLFAWDLNRQTQFPANFYNMDVVGNHVWALGTAGAVCHSSDGGLTYQFVATPAFNPTTEAYVDLGSVDFYDVNHGVLVGDGGLVAITSNAGQTWTTVTVTGWGTTNCNDVVYLSSGKIYVAGNEGKIAYSGDNGATWTMQTSNVSVAVYGISMNDAGTGYCALNAGTSTSAQSKILKTTDGGTTWTPINLTIANNPHLYKVRQFGSKVVLCGDKGYVGYSNDGVNWTNLEGIGGTTGKMQDVVMIGDVGYAVGWSSSTVWNNAVVKTTNGWATAEAVTNDMPAYFEGIGALSDGTLIGACWGGTMARSTNGAVHWSEQTVPVSFWYSASVIDDNNWFLAGDNAYLAKTTDGGDTFTKISIPGEWVRFYSVYFKDATEGWVTGKTTGKIYHTTDGGVNWTPYTVPGVASSKSFFKLFFVNNSTGYAVGPGNQSVKTTDGGLTWNIMGNVGLTATTTLYSCYFKDENTGFATSTAGKYFVTTDGGANWSQQTLGTTDVLDIRFKNANVGVLATKAGGLYYTSNGGLTSADWTAATESATGDVGGVYCDEQGNFWAAAYSSDASNLGNSWAVLKSTDNGASWTQEDLPSLTFNKTRLTGVTGKGSKIVAYGGNQVIFSQGGSAPQNVALDLFISEYIEGSSNNKAIEIFNGTGAPVDLSLYSVKLGANGGAWSNALTLTGTLANNDVYVISNAGAALAGITSVSDVTSTVTYYNGNDAIGLFKNDVLIDELGVQGQDPGASVGWSVAGVNNALLNHTLIRKPTVIVGTTDWAASAGTTADNSQWIVQAIDYVTDLGQHTFNPVSTPTAGSPVFSPAEGFYTTPIQVTLTSSTTGAEIRYTLDGTNPSQSSLLYSQPIAVSATTTIKARSYATGLDPSLIISANYSFPVVVSTLAQLRAQNPDNTTIYYVSGPAVLTFQQTFRHQKYFQDATAGILIDDMNGIVTTTYSVGDAVAGLAGKLALYGNMLQFTPTMNYGSPVSTGNVVAPVVATISELNANFDNYESKLVKIMNVSFTNPPSATFTNGVVYPLTDASGSANLRTTFYDVDYISTNVPTAAVNLVGICNSRAEGDYITPRNLADITTIANEFNPPSNLQYTVTATAVNLTWTAPTARHLKKSTRSLTGYVVYRDNVALNTAPITDTNYSDTNIQAGSSYIYTVTALYSNPTGESLPSNSVTAVIPSQPFNPPTDLTAVAGNAQVVLTWVAPTNGTPAGYKVYRNDVAITTALVIGLTYTDTSLTNGTSYNYKVTALYTTPDGESAPSNVVTATPTAPVLTPPSNLSAQVNGQTVSLQWTAPGTGEPGTNLTEGFEGSFPPANWTTVVTEPENTWMQAQTISFTSGDVAPHSGTYQAYLHFSFAAQDEWLITPQFTCPANASLSFYTYGYVGSTNLDHYYVKVSTDGGTNWTPLWDATAIQPAGNYTYADGPITIPMSTYAGQQIKVAWQGVDGDGEGIWHVWFLDDLAIGNGTETIRFDKASLAQKSNAASVVANHSVSNGFQSKQEYLLAQKGMTVRSAAPSLSLSKLTTVKVLSSRSQSGYNVYRDGSIVYTSTTPTVTTYQDTNVPFGQHVYKVTAVYTDGESTPTNEVTVNVEQAPNYVINDDFESYTDFSLTMGSWILTDVDAANTDQIDGITFLHSGSPMAYICFNPSATTPALTGFTPHSGAKVAASFVSLTPPNNDWMITPNLHLGTGSSFKFWAKSYTSTYGLEQFKVGVSTTNSTPNAMTFISGTTAVSAPTTWTEYSYDLSAYNGQDVYVGIQCISNNAFIFFVDDVRVISAGGHVPNEDPAVLPTVTSLSGNYPNPFNPSTTIRYSVKDKGSVKLDIYNSKGQKVKSLVNESKAAGNYNIVWDGRDDQNHAVASGVYFYRMTSGSYTATKKMIMMK